MKIISVFLLIVGLAAACAAQTVTESAAKQIESAAPELLTRAHEAGLAVVLIENCSVTWHRELGRHGA